MSDIEAYAGHRELLFSVVYNMLGTVADTEDVLQETWLSWTGRQDRAVESPRAYLVRIAVNHALTRMRRLRTAKEMYVGPWLPEPLLTSPDVAEGSALLKENLSMALLVVLETLSPLERAVFVLHEAFGYSYDEIAGILRRSGPAVRQLAHRAREHVQARRPRYEPRAGVQREVTERFLAAALSGDVDGLMEVLAPDVTLVTDGGGRRKAALRSITGRDKVVRLITSKRAAEYIPATFEIRAVELVNDPAIVLFAGETPYGLLVVDVTPDGERVRGIYGILNPDKLTRVSAT